MTLTAPKTTDEMKAARRALKWTQERMADELGISRRQYLNIEHGVTPVSLTLSRLAAYIIRENCR